MDFSLPALVYWSLILMLLHYRLASASIVEGHAVARIRGRKTGRMNTHWRNSREREETIACEGKVKISCFIILFSSRLLYVFSLCLFSPSSRVCFLVRFLFLLEPLTRFLSQAMVAAVACNQQSLFLPGPDSSCGWREAGGIDSRRLHV